MKTTICAIGLSAGLAFAGSAAQAACDTGKAGSEMSTDEVKAVYECLAADLHAGYAKGKKRWIPEAYVSDYRSWSLASTAPAAPGFHSGRFLVTYVNDVGFEEYVKYLEERGPMPAGTLIAKESFSVSEKGKVKPGPLFLMEKVETGKSPETGDWYYMMVSAKGVPQAVNVVTACSECHQGTFGFRDGMGYPVEEVRLGQ